MLARSRLLALAAVVLIGSGCSLTPCVDTVPWWKGLPCMVIAPSSLEGTVWRDHFHSKHHAEGGCPGCCPVID
jgi:hypothetical protein